MKGLNRNKGFSLVELLIVMVIVTIVTSISVFQFRNYSKERVVEQTAYEIALMVRQAQTYGISSSDTDTEWNEADSVEPTGLYFHYDNGSFGTEVKIYRDKNYVTDTASVFNQNHDLVLEVFTLPPGLYLRDISIDFDSVENDVTITFKRPSPEPYFAEDNPTLITEQTGLISIELSSFDGDDIREIYIEPTGYVYIGAS